jgi:hypothetical protein
VLIACISFDFEKKRSNITTPFYGDVVFIVIRAVELLKARFFPAAVPFFALDKAVEEPLKGRG